MRNSGRHMKGMVDVFLAFKSMLHNGYLKRALTCYLYGTFGYEMEKNKI